MANKYTKNQIAGAIEDMVCNNFNGPDIKRKYGMSIQIAYHYMTRHWFYKNEGVTIVLKSKI